MGGIPRQLAIASLELLSINECQPTFLGAMFFMSSPKKVATSLPYGKGATGYTNHEKLAIW
jgi:hypothetical protein